MPHGSESPAKTPLLFKLFAAAALLSMTACSPSNQGALTLDAQTNRPVLVLVLCPDEAVTHVMLDEVTIKNDVYGEGKTIWEIEAETPQRLTHYVVGQVPPGFRETISLATSKLEGDLHLTARLTGGLAVAAGDVFRPGELRANVLLHYGQPATFKDLENAAVENCSSNPFVSLGFPAWSWIPVLGILGIGVITLVLVTRSKRRRARHETTA